MRFEVFIRDERGQTRTVCVDSKEELKNMTVEEFIRRSFPKDNRELRFIYNGRQLQDDHTLASYNIPSGSTIYARVCLRGGGGPPPPEAEDKGIPRTASMDRLAEMQQTEPEPNTLCLIL
ncbi:uncharacterized protein LOC128014671 [Carassius gibelio]|uniref:uncharacterized protein LOC128014671 n=1 Tax=Carassius gibelio TaxID=101364 RepID=UPI0022778DE4|nr:uncharacterized protein LOC128014671 [Carassius gibelio]